MGTVENAMAIYRTYEYLRKIMGSVKIACVFWEYLGPLVIRSVHRLNWCVANDVLAAAVACYEYLLCISGLRAFRTHSIIAQV